MQRWRNKIFILKKNHPGFEIVKKAIIDSLDGKLEWKKMWDVIWNNLPEIKKEDTYWLNGFPKYDVIEFWEIKSDNDLKELCETREKRINETIKKYGINREEVI
jgi:hypothetical protein